jgi:hypothetical protein
LSIPEYFDKQVSVLQRLRDEEAQRTAEIQAALDAVKADGKIVEGREEELRQELDSVQRLCTERQVFSDCGLSPRVLCNHAVSFFTSMNTVILCSKSMISGLTV